VHLIHRARHTLTHTGARIGRAASFALTLAATAAFSAALSPMAAQETTGGIRGTVTAAGGAPVVGATVTAINVETGLSRSTSASAEGVYVIRLLPSGIYRVSARRIGSAPEERTGVRVTVGTTTTTNFVLRDAAVALGAVQVTAAPRIDARDGGLKQGVSTEEISNLPTLGRDFTDFINLSGLVSPTPETTTGGQFSIAGARPSQTNVQLDGVDANNSFFGENRGGSRIPFNFSIESVKEFQIVTNGFDVEYGNYAGGIINIISKSGTNNFHATAYGNYRGERFTRANFDGTKPNDFNVQQYAVQLDGPLVRNKLFYLVSVDAQRRREPFTPTSSATLRTQAEANAARAGTFTSADSIAKYNGLAKTDQATADSLERFYSILQNTYGVANAQEAYAPFFTSNDVLTAFARLDWNINGRNRLSIRNSYSDYDNANETFAATATGGLSKTEAFKNRTNSLVSELTSTFGSNIGNIFRMQYSSENRPRVASDRLPELRVNNVNAGRAFAWGGASVAFRNLLIENKFQLVDNMTMSRGNHTLKLGTNNLFAWYLNDFWLNGSGFYTFDNLTALEAGRPSRYTRNVRADGNPPTTSFSTQEYSGYLQDEWQTTPRLTTTVGLRYDVSRFGKRPGRVIDAERAFGIETGLAPIDNDNVSPRLSMAWDRKGDASEVFRGGIGFFYGRIPAVLGSNVGITDVPLLNLDCAGSTADGDPTAPPPLTGYKTLPLNGLGNPTNCAGTTGIGGVPEYSFWTNGFEIPQTLRGNVGYERSLGENTRFSADLLFTETSKLYTVRNINLRPALFTLANEGGRRVYVPANRFGPASAGGTDRLLNTDFGNVFTNHYDGRASSQAVTVNLDRRFGRESSLRGSYTWQRASDNSSFSCCTSFEGFSSTRIGALGPNEIGGVGDTEAAWGPSGFVRNHTFVLSGFTSLPLGFRLSGVWRLQSGTPWGPEQGGDLNGDGLSFNDRPFVFAADSLPVSVPASITTTEARAAYVAEQRARYGTILRDYSCVGDFVGSIIDRNTCRQPWFNRLDMSLRNRIPTRRGQYIELSLDLFNVLNGLSSKWGRYEAVTSGNRNLVTPVSYDAATNKILYTVPTGFGQERSLGANLLLQFSAQLGVRYVF
jgi:hypothetical protein